MGIHVVAYEATFWGRVDVEAGSPEEAEKIILKKPIEFFVENANDIEVEPTWEEEFI